MNQQQILFEPNLKFALELREDLKPKYFDQCEKAKLKLGNISCFMKNMYHEYQKLLSDFIEVSVTNEELNQIINQLKSNQQTELTQKGKTVSEVHNCHILPEFSNNDKNDEINRKMIQTENITELVPIFSSDFNSDIEDGICEKCKSPPPSVINSPLKVQNSPILSKRNKNNMKKINSSMSNTSLYSTTSSNDSKINLSNNTFDKNIDSDIESDKETVMETNKKPLKSIENTYISTSNSQERNKDHKVLGVSKTNFGKSNFSDSGKRFRQTTLTLTKAIPVIDISKADSNESYCDKNYKVSKVNNAWTETSCSNEFPNRNMYKADQELSQITKLNEPNIKENNKTIGDSDKYYKSTCKKHCLTGNDDESVETSPIHESDKSKLRNKLNFKQKESFKINVKTPKEINNEITTDVKKEHKKYFFACGTGGDKLNEKRNTNLSISKDKSSKKLFDKTTLTNETYFSPAERLTNRNISNCEENKSDFEDDTKCRTPPSKKMLLDSFDIVPQKKEGSPNYAYKEAAVRNKNERAQLPGWSCRDCDMWYGHLPENERRKRKNQCSKHRGKYKADVLTPDSFWNPVFDDTNNSSSSDED